MLDCVAKAWCCLIDKSVLINLQYEKFLLYTFVSLVLCLEQIIQLASDWEVTGMVTLVYLSQQIVLTSRVL